MVNYINSHSAVTGRNTKSHLYIVKNNTRGHELYCSTKTAFILSGRMFKTTKQHLTNKLNDLALGSYRLEVSNYWHILALLPALLPSKTPGGAVIGRCFSSWLWKGESCYTHMQTKAQTSPLIPRSKSKLLGFLLSITPSLNLPQIQTILTVLRS